MDPDWVDVFPMANGDFPTSYDSLPKGNSNISPWKINGWSRWNFLFLGIGRVYSQLQSIWTRYCLQTNKKSRALWNIVKEKMKSRVQSHYYICWASLNFPTFLAFGRISARKATNFGMGKSHPQKIELLEALEMKRIFFELRQNSITLPSMTLHFFWGREQHLGKRKKWWRIDTWQFFVTFFGMVKWPFQRLSDLQLGDEQVTLNYLVCCSSPARPVEVYFDSDGTNLWTKVCPSLKTQSKSIRKLVLLRLFRLSFWDATVSFSGATCC